MLKKILIYTLLFSFSLSITGCNNINKKASSTLGNNSNVDDILNNYNFKISKSIDSKIIYIAFLNARNLSLKDYEVTNGKTINITCRSNEKFVVSLHANSTIAYSWNTNNDFNNSILKFEKETKIAGLGNYKNSKNTKNTIGTSFRRQNFYFKPLKNGNTKLSFKYCHLNSLFQAQNCFNFNVFVHIE